MIIFSALWCLSDHFESLGGCEFRSMWAYLCESNEKKLLSEIWMVCSDKKETSSVSHRGTRMYSLMQKPYMVDWGGDEGEEAGADYRLLLTMFS